MMHKPELTCALPNHHLTSEESGTATQAPVFSRSLLRTALTTILSLFVIATIGFTAWKLNADYQLTAPLSSSAFMFAVVLAVAYRIANPFGWVLVLRGIGHAVGPVQATKIWLLAESRRWLPGGIWGYTSRAVAAKQMGVSKTSASASMAIELLVTIVAAAIVGFIGVAIYQQELLSTVAGLIPQSDQHGYAMVAAVVAVGSCLMAVMVVLAGGKLKRKIKSLTQQIAAVRQLKLSPSWLGLSIGYMTLMAVLNGSINQALLQTIDGASVPLVAMIAVTATAWVIGFFAFFSPGGILVREAALAALLLPWLPYETGFTIAALSRLAQLIAEVIGMLLTIKK